MIREEPGNLLGCVKCGQKQSRKFRDNLIHDADAGSKSQIGDSWRVCVVRDRIQSFPRQKIVH